MTPKQPRTRAYIEIELGVMKQHRERNKEMILGRVIDAHIASLTAEHDALPEVDEALQCWNAVMDEYHKARPYRQAPNCLAIIRAALDKARADGDADLRARLERAEGLLDRIAAEHSIASPNRSWKKVDAILAERDTGDHAVAGVQS
jgi:hypothetical protein